MAANTQIVQTPSTINTPIPVGQPLIFVVENTPIVDAEIKVKFVAKVYIGREMINVTLTDDLIGTFKTTPNAAGKGMFDFSNLVDSYVKADHLASPRGSTFKGILSNETSNRHPLHLVDKFSLNNNCARYMIIEFHTEALDTTLTPPSVAQVDGSDVKSTLFSIFNGYLKSTDQLFNTSLGSFYGFGYDMQDFILDGSDKKFLTNAPLSQSANLDDYGTVAFFAHFSYYANFDRIKLFYYDSDGVHIGDEAVLKTMGTGAWSSYALKSKNNILYLGCYPANLRNWSSTFNALVTNGTIDCGRIDVTAFAGAATQISDTYSININAPDGKGYESIRLAWLNQWGVWDYYTFTKKSTKTISTKGTTYEQLGGTWNERRYYPDGFSGGKKAFRVNATEKIKMNTDFVTENDSVIFEELINSPEVYVLGTFNEDDTANLILNTYVTPARITTSSFTRKTIANDKLMQYTFEVEKSKTLRTQSV
jgi:hypothetical protein